MIPRLRSSASLSRQTNLRVYSGQELACKTQTEARHKPQRSSDDGNRSVAALAGASHWRMPMLCKRCRSWPRFRIIGRPDSSWPARSRDFIICLPGQKHSPSLPPGGAASSSPWRLPATQLTRIGCESDVCAFAGTATATGSRRQELRKVVGFATSSGGSGSGSGSDCSPPGVYSFFISLSSSVDIRVLVGSWPTARRT